MVTLASPSPLDRILAEHVANLTGFVLGTAGYGQRFQATQYEDSTNYANTLGNKDTTNGRALKIQYGDPASPTTLATFQKSAILLQSNDGTKSITISNSGISISGNVIYFDITGYGAVSGGSAATNRAAINSAVAACAAAGGGVVWIPAGNYSIDQRITVSHPGVRIVGQGLAVPGVNPKSVLTIDFTAMPAIVFGNTGASAGPGSACGVENITFVHNQTAATSSFEGGTVGATIVVDRAGGSTVNGDFALRNVSDPSAISLLQIGTVNAPKGARHVLVEGCSTATTDSFVVVKGCSYLYVLNNRSEESPARGGGAFVLFDGGSGTTMPDPFHCEGNLAEDYSRFVSFRHSGGSVGNSLIANNVADGCAIGVYLNPQSGGTVNALSVLGNTLNGFGDGAGTGTSNTWGVLVDQDGTGAVRRLIVQGNRLANFGHEGIRVEAPAADALLEEFWFDSNVIEGCGQVTSNTYAGISLNASGGFGVNGAYITNNRVTSRLTTNKTRHAVSVSAGNSNFIVAGNVGLDMATSVIEKGTAGNGTTAIYRDNHGALASGDAPPDVLIPIGPFHYSNPGASLASTDMPLPSTDSNVRFIAPYAGRVVAISLSCAGAAISAAANRTATATVSVNGSAGTLATTFTPDGSLFGSRNTQTTGDTFSAGDRLGIKLATGAGWTATDDVSAWIWVTPT